MLFGDGDHIDIWRVETSLGSGGMGSVYRCHNRNAKRIRAAIKVLDAAIQKSPGARERFVREAEILFGLDHPNIVKVRNIRVDATPPYLEMEFVEGLSLEAHLRRGAPPFEQALVWLRQLASAVAYLHGRGVRHRDIKPANLLIDPDRNLKLVDFGLAVEAEGTRLTQSNTTFGTVSYAPPEWSRPETLDPEHWDIYAAGVVFWEVLTGRVAFPVSGQGSARQQAMQVMIAKQGHKPLDPGPDFHDDLRALVRGMTESDASRRTDSMAMVAARLLEVEPTRRRQTGATIAPLPEGVDVDTWVDDLPVRDSWAKALAATPVPARPRGSEDDTIITHDGPLRPRRTPWVLAGALAGVVVLAIGTSVLLWTRGAHRLPDPVPATAPAAIGTTAATPTTSPEPAPTEPAPTEPAPTEPAPTEPAAAVAAPKPVPAVVSVAPKPTAPRAVPPEPVAPKPDTDLAPVATAAVTASAFARWVASNPDWARERAIERGFADASYLEDWGAAGPTDPTAGVVNVSWYAAAAYCASRGGLADADAPPLTWSEGTAQPPLEWRASGGKPAWRDGTGKSSTQATLESSNGFTGFRCAR